jgi:hypothetical protein
LRNWGTCWEPIGNLKGNILRTHWEAGKYEKIPHPLPSKHKRKKRHLECMLGPSRWLHEISLPKRLGHHFWPGLTPLAKNTLPIQCGGRFDFKNINYLVFQTFQI